MQNNSGYDIIIMRKLKLTETIMKELGETIKALRLEKGLMLASCWAKNFNRQIQKKALYQP